MKGLIFAGCSYTWGQGLHYYSNLETIDAQKRYISTLRYPRLVSNYFNTFEVVSKENDGSETSTINFLSQAFDRIDSSSNLIDDKFSYNDIEYVIIQTSIPDRTPYSYIHNGEEKSYCKYYNTEIKRDFYEWLFEENKWSFWYNDHLKNVMFSLKNEMVFYESNGIKPLILSLEDGYINIIKEDPWLNDRFISLNYKNKNYDCIQHLILENSYLSIDKDYDNFENPPKDLHPSKECHQIIANNIINKIKNTKIEVQAQPDTQDEDQIEVQNEAQTEVQTEVEVQSGSKIFENNKINLVYDSWDDENDKPLEPNCNRLYEDCYVMPIDSIIRSFNINDVCRYKLSDVKKYPDSNFYYFITIMPGIFEQKILNSETPILLEVIECWKLCENFNIIIMNDQESESYQTFLILHNWTKNLNLNQNKLWLINNNPKLKEYKDELNSEINVYSTRNLIKFATASFENSIGKIKFNVNKKGLLFLCHNKRPRPSRYGILVLLKKYNILDDVDWSLVNGWLFDKKNYYGFYFNVFSQNDINDLIQEIEYFSNIDQKKSMYEEDKTWFDDRKFENPVPWGDIYEKETYENTYFNIATETNFEVDTIHITEKSFKPFLALQFPLILATKDHIKKMRELYDFDFFDDIINHDYDNIENPRDRLFRFIDEVKRIHNNKDFFIDFYKNNKDRFIKNQNKIIKMSKENYDRDFLLSIIKNEKNGRKII